MYPHEATGHYLVEYDAFATLDRDDMDWHGQLYRLCASPDVSLTEVITGDQHIKPLPFPELAIFQPAVRGKGLGKGRAGRAPGRGRGGVGRGGGGGGS